jgi:20S proteasome subunit alpha 2
MVYSGMGPDYRVLVDKARKVSHTGYKRIYNEYPPTRILVQDVARVMQEATQSGGVRPYGVSLLIAGWDEGILPEDEEAAAAQAGEGEEKKPTGKTGGILKGGPMLYQVDPSGSYFPWKATAIGKSATSAKTFLEKRYTEGLELEDAVHIALLTLKETIEGEMNGETIEIGELSFGTSSGTRLTQFRHRRTPGGPSPRHRGRRGCPRPPLQEADSPGDRGLPDEPVESASRHDRCNRVQ